MSGQDFRPLVGRRVAVVAGSFNIGGGGTTVVESVVGDVVTLKTGKFTVRPIDARRVESVSVFPEL